jgi:hypothetical protein
MHFAPTFIGFSNNVENTVYATNVKRLTFHVFTQTAQEGTSTGFCRAQSQRFLCTSLAASAGLLSSVTAFNLVAVIICGIGGMSRLGKYSGLAHRLRLGKDALYCNIGNM